VRRWQRETDATLGNGKCSADLKREAKAAWRHFIWCVRALPLNEAAPLCQIASAEMAKAQHSKIIAPSANNRD